jgi:transposase
VSDIHGIGPLGAAIILGHTGDIDRFPTSGHFARYTGTAPSPHPAAQATAPPLNQRWAREGNRDDS